MMVYTIKPSKNMEAKFAHCKSLAGQASQTSGQALTMFRPKIHSQGQLPSMATIGMP